MKPKVTLGVCVKNAARTLEQTTKCIVNQDFPVDLMEVIFVDDGSQDNTFQIIQKFALTEGVKTRIIHRGWKGLGRSRNDVVDNAEGDYIVWVDGDMILPSDYVRKQVEFMERNPAVGIAKGKYLLLPSNNLTGTLEIYSRAAEKMADLNKTSSKALGTGGAIYRLSTVKKVKGFDDTLTGYGEDWDIENRIRSAGWLLRTTDSQFQDLERLGITYTQLWLRYTKRGHDLYFFYQKNKALIRLYKMLPFAGILTGFLGSIKVYKQIQRKTVFLLPVHNMFKLTAWYVGFIESHFDSKAPLSPLVKV
jgi:glycosyltransferase involved in cell wall biosynthesis